MTSLQYQKIKKIIEQALRELESVAVKKGKLFSKNYEKVVLGIKNRILNKAGFTLAEYLAVEAEEANKVKEANEEPIKELNKRIDALPTKAEVAGMSEDIAKKHIPAPQIINKIVKEIVKEKPTVIEKYEEAPIEELRNDINYLKTEFQELSTKKTKHKDLLEVGENDHHAKAHSLISHEEDDYLEKFKELISGKEITLHAHPEIRHEVLGFRSDDVWKEVRSTKTVELRRSDYTLKDYYTKTQVDALIVGLGGASQTPWTSDIDAAGYGLSGLGSLTFTKETAHIIKIADSTTADTDGGALSVQAGTGNGTGAGGSMNLTGGKGGLTGSGGEFGFLGGDGGNTSGSGGDVTFTGGNSVGASGNGGNIIFTPGTTNSGQVGTIRFADPVSGFIAKFDTSLLAADRTFTFPDASGTFALTSDLTSFLTAETDPVFTAWDKSTGISVTESQISDLKAYLTDAPSDGNTYGRKNAAWVQTSGGSATYAGLSDVNLTSLADGQLTKYDNASGKWINFTPAYLTSLAGAVLTDQTSGQTIGATGARLTKLWATDITCTNAIAGSVTGNAGTVTGLTITAGASISGSNTGDQDLSGLIPKSTVTTKGDLIIATGNAAVTRFAAGAVAGFLKTDGSGNWSILSGTFANNTPAVSNKFITAYDSSTGTFTQAQPSQANITGLTTADTPTFAGLKDSALTSGRVTFAKASGELTDDAAFTFGSGSLGNSGSGARNITVNSSDNTSIFDIITGSASAFDYAAIRLSNATLSPGGAVSLFTAASAVPNEMRIAQYINAPMTFYTNNTERMRILATGVINIPNLTASKLVFTDASKNLTSTGIGTSSQYIKGDGSLDSNSYAISNQTMYIGTTAEAINRSSAAQALTGITGLSPAADGTTAFQLYKADGSTALFTMDTTNSVITMNTKLVMQPSADATYIFQNAGSEQGMYAYRNLAGYDGAFWISYRARGTKGSPTVILNGDRMGEFLFRGWDGGAWTDGAAIFAEVDGTPGSSVMPGRIIFSTTPAGSNVVTEQMRLDSTGKLTLSGGSQLIQSATVTPVLNVQDNGGAHLPQVYITSLNASGFYPSVFGFRRASAAGGATPNSSAIGKLFFDGFDSNGTYAAFAQIQCNIGTNAAGGAPSSLIFYTSSSGSQVNNTLTMNADGSLTSPATYAKAVGGTNRAMYVDSTGVIGNLTSSLRYKENVTDIGDTSWIYQLRPVNFDYIDKTRGTGLSGLIAEEVAKVNPKLVTYLRTETQVENDDGTFTTIYGEDLTKPDTVEYSSPTMIASLIKEIQLLNQRIKVLESK
jgi:hypothetical protein